MFSYTRHGESKRLGTPRLRKVGALAVAALLGGIATLIVIEMQAGSGRPDRMVVPADATSSAPIPRLLGLQIDQARNVIANVNIPDVSIETYSASSPLATGTVIAQSPRAGTPLQSGMVLQLCLAVYDPTAASGATGNSGGVVSSP